MGIHKIDRKWGSRGLVPLGCLRLRGREGVTLAIPTECVLERFSTEQKNSFLLRVIRPETGERPDRFFDTLRSEDFRSGNLLPLPVLMNQSDSAANASPGCDGAV